MSILDVLLAPMHAGEEIGHDALVAMGAVSDNEKPTAEVPEELLEPAPQGPPGPPPGDPEPTFVQGLLSDLGFGSKPAPAAPAKPATLEKPLKAPGLPSWVVPVGVAVAVLGVGVVLLGASTSSGSR